MALPVALYVIYGYSYNSNLTAPAYAKYKKQFESISFNGKHMVDSINMTPLV